MTDRDTVSAPPENPAGHFRRRFYRRSPVEPHKFYKVSSVTVSPSAVARIWDRGWR